VGFADTVKIEEQSLMIHFEDIRFLFGFIRDFRG